MDADPRLPFLRHVGIRVLPEDDGPTVCEIDLRDDLRNRAGMLQGGVTATLLDVVGGVAAARVAGTPAIATADLNIHYLAPIRVGPARAEATVLRKGRSTVIVEARVIDAGANERLCAMSTMTLTVLGPETRAVAT